jgi:hypothetical protein
VSLELEDLKRLLEGESLPAEGLPVGPVALIWDGRVLGRGMVGRSGLRHQIGGSYADRLRTLVTDALGEDPG